MSGACECRRCLDYTHAPYRTCQPGVAKTPRFRIKFGTGGRHSRAGERKRAWPLRPRFNRRPNGGCHESIQVAANPPPQAKGQEASQEPRQAGEEAETEKSAV